jgi:hypothetical protein
LPRVFKVSTILAPLKSPISKNPMKVKALSYALLKKQKVTFFYDSMAYSKFAHSKRKGWKHRKMGTNQD